jgi:hypothetical protein
MCHVLYKDVVCREMKRPRAGMAFAPARGNEGGLLPRREAGAKGCGSANSATAIDSALICVGLLGALPMQRNNGQKTTDF